MSVKKIPINTSKCSFFVEANPDNSGVRFAQEIEGNTCWVATIIDNESNFVFSSMHPQGLLMQTFKPTHKLLLKDGTSPSIEDEDQIEVETPYGKKIVVRHICSDKSPKGVVVAYTDGGCLKSVALCTVPYDQLVFTFAD